MSEGRGGWSEFLSTPLDRVAAGVMRDSWVGRRIGVYEIVAALGAGGMGEVYRARDTRLGRDVAIKVLPTAVSADVARLGRFEREARVLASLNHPHIAAIYGIEEPGGAAALVLEFVDGETLASRIARGPLSWTDALAIVRQVAQALEAAHDKGIVHRDLKPANIALTNTGTVKVLDFGLARFDPRRDMQRAQSPTMTADRTAEGLAAGTAAYMSPEQARGQTVDVRTDIWAFGCVLYEMLTGHVAFPGQTAVDHAAAVLEREPDWSALRPATPAHAIRVLRRCLQKDPSRRFHDIADVRLELDEPMSGADDVPPEQVARSRNVVLSTVVLAALVIAGVEAWRLLRPPAAVAPSVARVTIDLPHLVAGYHTYDISPDGALVVFVAQPPGGAQQLFVRRIDQFASVPLPGTERGSFPTFSPDGRWILFHTQMALKKIAAVPPGSPLQVCNVSDMLVDARWGDNDTVVFASRGHGLQMVPSGGGTPQDLSIPDASQHEVDYHNAILLPGSKAVLFTIHAGTGIFRVAVLDLVTGRKRTLIESGFDARYLPTGHLLYAAENGLFLAPFDLGSLQVTGAPIRVIENVATVPNDGEANFSLSTVGTLLYTPMASRSGRTLVWVDRRGSAESLRLPPREYEYPRLSPAGRELAFGIVDGWRRDLWTYEPATDHLRRSTLDGSSTTALWSADGHNLAFAGSDAKSHRLMLQRSDGSQPPEVLLSSMNTLTPMAWTPDGRLLYIDNPPTDQSIIGLADGLPRGLHRSLFDRPTQKDAALSPDGRWLAFISDADSDGSGHGGMYELFVAPYPALMPRRQLTAGGAREVRWRADGRELFYRQGDDVVAVSVDPAHGLAAAKPHVLFSGQFVRSRAEQPVAGYDVTADGSRFLMVKPGDDELTRPPVHLIVHWDSEILRSAGIKQ